MQEDLIAEQSEKAAFERILEKEKDLMDSALQREMGRASSLQVEVLAAQQQRVCLIKPIMDIHMPWTHQLLDTALLQLRANCHLELPKYCPQ